MKKILIIEDSLEAQEMISYLLAKAYELHFAASVNSSISILKKRNFDLIICDFQLTDGTGDEVIHYLRKVQNNTPTIIFSGMTDLNISVTQPIIHVIDTKDYRDLLRVTLQYFRNK